MSQKDNPETENLEGRFSCACHSHELSIYPLIEDGYVEMGYWQRGKGEQPWGWKTRIKTVWDILLTGNPHSDMVILDKENIIKLRDNLTEIINKFK